METEMEKTSYTLNHNGEDKEEPKTESYEPLIEEEPAVETDKMLSKDEPAAVVKKSTEMLAEVTETTALDEKVEAVKEKEVTNVSAKNRFLQWFERKKPKTETPEAPETPNGNGVAAPAETSAIDGAAAETTNPPKRRFIPLKLQNPFAKKATETVTPVDDDKDKTTTVEASSSDEKKVDSPDEKKTETKFKPLASISFPSFSGIINKFRKSGRSDDIELGKKAGLASMETLDDSTKDPWNQENGGDAVDADKPEEPKKAEGAPADDEEKKVPLLQSIRNYNCSVDDCALIAGIVVFFILVSLIVAFTFWGKVKVPRAAPIRDNKVLAVTSCGMVEGRYEDSAIEFRGIPYAKPPTDARRFEHAEVINNISYCFNGTLIAHSHTVPECMQMTNGELEGVEDCLSLDIVTPEVRYINLLPVVVLIGANDFMGGSPGLLRPSAVYARIRDVVFVRPRFRMNVFGFMALESLSNSSNIPSSGNYALTDIIAALEWVQQNIRNFGGDPSSVTLFGHRAGATLVTALTSSAKASKLFTRAWASSPSARYPGKDLTVSERENIAYGQAFPNCDDKMCWQTKDETELNNKVPESWSKDLSTSLPSADEKKSNVHEFLVLDGVVLKKHLQEAWKSDPNIATKLVIGTTAHVAYDKSNPSLFPANMTADDVRAQVEDSKIGLANLTEEALSIYGETVQGLISMISDIRFVCPLVVLARSQGNLPFYIVTQTNGEMNLADVDSDIQAILGRYQTETPEKRRYQDAIRQLFYYYVGHGKLTHYGSQNFIMRIEQDVYPENNYKNCDFWIKNEFVPHYATVF